jgi:nitrous oxidase accessory protein
MNERGNGIYVWNAPGSVVEGNDVRYGRDGIFTNTSRKNIFRNNTVPRSALCRALHVYHDSEVSGNVSIGNHLGYAIMFSDRVKVTNNLSRSRIAGMG